MKTPGGEGKFPLRGTGAKLGLTRSGLFLGKRTLTEVAHRENRDRLPDLVDLIDHDIAADHQPSQARVDLFRKPPAEKGML